MRKTIGAVAAFLGAAALGLACSSSSGGGGTSSCLEQQVGSACLSCAQNSCGSQLSSYETSCSAYLSCICPGGNVSCSAVSSTTCGMDASEASCAGAQQAISSCVTASCSTQCNTQMNVCAGDSG